MEAENSTVHPETEVTPPVVGSAEHLASDGPPAGQPGEVEEQRLALGATPAARIMIVDDEPINIKVVRKHLQGVGYKDFVAISDPTKALGAIRQEQPDVILMDIMMPVVSGLEILQRIRDEQQWTHLPVIILTAYCDEDTKRTALELGATDFLAKPVSVTDLVPRIRNALIVKAHYDHLQDYASELERQVQQRTAELAASRLELIHCLARAAEYRDNETGRHVIRVARYAGIIARKLHLPSSEVELIEHAAPLHDIGKIGIPDAILLKPDKLTPEEYESMQRHTAYGKRTFELLSPTEWYNLQRHTVVGESMLDVRGSPILEMAGKIALTHHEKWDGSGYPLHLAGEDIPLEGRIVAVADVFDALSTKRPYKPALPLDECFAIMEEGRGSHFDPHVLDAFLACREDIVKIRIQHADVD